MSGKCERCGAHREVLHKHHLKLQSEGGTDEDGVEMLCGNCHEDEHGGPFGGTSKGRLSATPEALAKRSAAMKALWQEPGFRRKMQARKPRTSKRPPEQDLRRLNDQDLTQEEIGKQLGVPQSTISMWFREYGIPARKTDVRAKRVELDLDLVREMRADGQSVNGISKLLEVDRSTLRYRMRTATPPIA